MIDYKVTLKKEQAFIVSGVFPKLKNYDSVEDVSRSCQELSSLLQGLDITPKEIFIQQRSTIDGSTILGKGKLEEIKTKAHEQNIELIVFDLELSAGQVTQIGKIIGKKIIDRYQVILEIFAKQAFTTEAKLQIELAKLRYLLPRLAGRWSHFTRQRGGVGFTGGEGEQQIELDRRMIRDRIHLLGKKLKSSSLARTERKKQRTNKALITALVGYTNAGKSSLFNKLCQQNTLAEDKLFATLDTTYRSLTPHSKPPILLIDTVGFLSNIPNTLIKGFQSTLLSAEEADLLLIVSDISDPHCQKQLEVSLDVLKELGLDKTPHFFIFTKIDLIENHDSLKISLFKKKYPDSFFVNSFDSFSMKNLREFLIEYFLRQLPSRDLFIPYEASQAHSSLASTVSILERHPLEKGMYYKIRAPDFLFSPLGLHQFLLSPEEVQEIFKN